MSIRTGRYYISNVKHSNSVTLGDPDDGTPLTGKAMSAQGATDHWSIVRLSNGNYTIQNVGNSSFANSGRRSKVGDTVEGRFQVQQFVIQETRVRGQYTVATTDSRLYWSLQSGEDDTPVNLSSSPTDSRNWWTFHPETAQSLDAPSGNVPLSSLQVQGASVEDTHKVVSTLGPLINPPVDISSQIDPNALRLFALLIGINTYANPNVRNLHGAVSDAKAIQEYLEVTLGVPKEQISHLHNSQATRAAIVQKLTELRMDSRIQRGDPILIYYAGHGGETEAPVGWETNDTMVQMIIPYDFNAESEEVITKLSGDENIVYAIPDRTIGALLEWAALEKGDNITVIFDCCHSGSGTRGFRNDPNSQDRTLGITATFPANIDMDILGNSRKLVSEIPAGFLQSNLQSHVLLAACNSNELAREVRGRGVFTQALLKALRDTGIENLSYSDLIDGLPSLIHQTPQCEGVNQNRILFNSRIIVKKATS